VELAIRDPKDVSTRIIKDLITACNLLVPAIGTGQAFLEEELSLSHPENNIRQTAIERIKSHIGFASQFNAMVIIGLIRGRTKSEADKDKAISILKDSLYECASFAQRYKIFLVIEPLNRYETNLINTAKDGIDLIKNIGSPQIGLLLDTFHMSIEEVSIEQTIREAALYLRHFHVADSNRWSPGGGHMDFNRVITTLKEIDYNGFLSAEILPMPNPEEASLKTIEFLKNII
jgi:sugar phosphate isomerase/epimerase